MSSTQTRVDTCGSESGLDQCSAIDTYDSLRYDQMGRQMVSRYLLKVHRDSAAPQRTEISQIPFVCSCANFYFLQPEVDSITPSVVDSVIFFEVPRPVRPLIENLIPSIALPNQVLGIDGDLENVKETTHP